MTTPQGLATRAATWRILLAAVFVLSLAGATAYVLLRDDAPASLPLAAEDAPLVTLTPAPPTDSDAVEVGVLDAARRALDAWGRFGVSGDLREVAPHFDERGPQYRKFIAESAALRKDPPGPPAYRFALSAPDVSGSGGDRVVAGRVAVTRPGEDAQSFSWEIVLRTEGVATWKFWTVRSR